MSKNRTITETDWFEDPSPAGSKRQQYVTYDETEDYLVNHIRAYLKRDNGYIYLSGYPTLTVHKCWDGYSEYTITATWDEIHIRWGDYEAFFDSSAAFLQALSEVELYDY